MRNFSCKACQQLLFFENSGCVNCKAELAYSPDADDFFVLPDGVAADAAFELELPGGKRQSFRRCKNAGAEGCNWLLSSSAEPGAEEQAFCLSCRLSSVIPNLSNPEHHAAWLDIERCKRRLLFTLRALGLPVLSKLQDAEAGLTFKFLSDTDQEKVMTGHSDGVITLNIAEANAALRENMREKLGEAYRTVLGHLRHEIGHYYWDRLVKDQAALAGFRSLFGDDRQSYEAALERHYDQGPPANWADSFISAYATMHPWEDWAETWAHYLHMVDTLETAQSHGLSVRIPGLGSGAKVATEVLKLHDFDSMCQSWHSVTLALNSLNRSMGMKDAYPFVLSPPVQRKLRFIHDLIRKPAALRRVARKAAPASAPASRPGAKASTGGAAGRAVAPASAKG